MEGEASPRTSGFLLVAYIDDATSEVYGRFYDYEGTLPAMASFKGYIMRYGLPQCLYVDRHSTYKSQAEPSVEKQLAGVVPVSQFERAVGELGVDVIHAHSPRIERLFRTFQDRLVTSRKEDFNDLKPDISTLP